MPRNHPWNFPFSITRVEYPIARPEMANRDCCSWASGGELYSLALGLLPLNEQLQEWKVFNIKRSLP